LTSSSISSPSSSSSCRFREGPAEGTGKQIWQADTELHSIRKPFTVLPPQVGAKSEVHAPNAQPSSEAHA
jgi:hypothetical protein